MSDDVEFQQRMRKIEDLVNEIEAVADPRVRSRAVELVSLLMELHGAGLAAWSSCSKNPARPAAWSTALRAIRWSPACSCCMACTRSSWKPASLQALDKVRPLLKSHGGNVELLEIDEGMVHLRLKGSCHGCPSSAQTLKNAIEEAIYEFAPDVVELKVEGAAPPVAAAAGFVPLKQLV